jgi:hypothetical protein
VVTPEQAKQAYLALAQGPTAAFLKAATGSLREISTAQASLLASPEAVPDPSTTHDVTVWVGHQSSYPASFLCIDSMGVSGRPTTPYLFRLDRASASAPWTVSYQMQFASPADIPAVALDGSGYAQSVSSERYGRFTASPASLARDYAAYLGAGNSTDDHEFVPGQFTSGLIDANNKVIRSAAQDKHVSVTESWSITGDPVAAYLLSDGGVLVLLGVRATAHAVPRSGTITIVQDGRGVTAPAPGKYRDTTTVSLLLAAFTVPPKGSADKVSAVAGYNGAVSSTGTPPT